MLRDPGQIRGFSPSALCRIAGVCLFTAAFFLPAVQIVGFARWPGYIVALVTLQQVPGLFLHARMHDYSFGSCLLELSGLVSPLALFCILLSFFSNALKVRLVFAFATFILLTVAILVVLWSRELLGDQMMVVPFVGHYVWAAGTLLIVLPEFFHQRQLST